MSEREVRIAFAGVMLSMVGLACDTVVSTDETKRSALVGDPIESVVKVQGVAPVTINNATAAPDGGSIDSTSFTIGLFDEDAATLCPNPSISYCLQPDGINLIPGGCPCTIVGDLDPLHRGFPNPTPYPAFDDVSVIEVAVNVGSAKAMSWDWAYKAYMQQPFGEFWVEVVDQNSVATTVIAKTGAPQGWGFRTNRQPAAPAYTLTGQHIDLDLTPWAGQAIKVRFALHSNYDPGWFTVFSTPPLPPTFTGVYDMGASKVYVDNLRVDTCSVTSVEIEELNSPLDPNPNYAGGGLRIFPDKQSPEDFNDRSQVRVVAHTQPHCRVSFRAVDVDDVSLFDSESGNDNYGGCGSFVEQGAGPSCAGTVDAGDNGLAIATYGVGRQPGDNVVIVAGTDSTAIAGVTTRGTQLFDPSHAVLDAHSPIKMSPMLTVWRRLHIERDSMGPVTDNHVSAAIADVRLTDPNTVQVAMNRGLFSGRFEGGRLVVGSLSFPIARSDEIAVYLTNPAAVSQLRIGADCTLYDDDDFNLNDGLVLHGDEGEDVPPSDISLLQDSDIRAKNVLAAAYIRPTYDLGLDGPAPFVLNVPEDSIPGIRSLFSAFDRRDREADPDFWTIYMLGAYEDTISEANDPSNPVDGATFGRSDPLASGSGGLGLATFRETITDLGEDALDNAATTSAHEVGHLFGADHGDNGLMCDEDGTKCNSTEFTEASLQRIRRALSP